MIAPHRTWSGHGHPACVFKALTAVQLRCNLEWLSLRVGGGGAGNGLWVQMARRSKRTRPSSPAEILARNALRRGEQAANERRSRRDPARWGLPEGLQLLPANEDLSVVNDPHRKGRILRARRSDAFSLVSMSEEQERAAARYFRDWMERVGVNVDGEERMQDLSKIDNSPGLAPGQHHNQRMLDAAGRVAEAHAEVGRASARLLEALVEPLAMRGEIRVWRVVVKVVTGETERHAQAARVRQACEDLHLAYEAVDARERAKRQAQSQGMAAGTYAGGGSAG